MNANNKNINNKNMGSVTNMSSFSFILMNGIFYFKELLLLHKNKNENVLQIS